MIRGRRYLLTGRVQGVGFRYFVRGKAAELGVSGWVRNLRDGRVECHAEGVPALLQEFETCLAAGPATGRVDSMEAREEVVRYYSTFSIEV